MTGVLRFKLPEEQEEFDLACQAGRLACALWNIANEVRRLRKYENHGDEARGVLEDLQSFVADEMVEAGLEA